MTVVYITYSLWIDFWKTELYEKAEFCVFNWRQSLGEWDEIIHWFKGGVMDSLHAL